MSGTASSGERVLVITGAAGVVGRELISHLSREHRVIGLVHSPAELPGADVLVCDLAAPRLGLSESVWEELAELADVVVHSGAITTWGLSDEAYRRVNIDGTRRVIDLARRAEAPVHVISSCFVRAFDLAGRDLRADNVVRPYIASKREAERVVRESGVPYNIYRPTNLVGHSANGASSRRQIVQMMADWLGRGKADYFPAHAGNLVDVAPVDLCSVAVRGLIRSGEAGRELWLTYGEDAMTVAEAFAVIQEHAARNGRRIEAVPIVDGAAPPPIPMESVSPMSRAYLKVLADVSEVTWASGGELPSCLPELRHRFDAPRISCRDAFRQSLDYWAAARQHVGATNEHSEVSL